MHPAVETGRLALRDDVGDAEVGRLQAGIGRMMMRKRGLLLAAVLALLAMANTAGAQTATGQITGTVKDATGAVAPGATVTVHSDLTGLTRTANSNTSGDYSFPLLPIGVYSVSAELSGSAEAA